MGYSKTPIGHLAFLVIKNHCSYFLITRRAKCPIGVFWNILFMTVYSTLHQIRKEIAVLTQT